MTYSAKSRAVLALSLWVALLAAPARAAASAAPLLSRSRMVFALVLGAAAMNESGPFGFSGGVDSDDGSRGIGGGGISTFNASVRARF